MEKVSLYGYMNNGTTLQLGVIEVYTIKDAAEQPAYTWEWRGPNGRSDGGTGQWVASGTNFRFEMTSNISKSVIGVLYSIGWKTNPPLVPWFAQGTYGGGFDYKGSPPPPVAMIFWN
jgi:hypothetical protein